MDKRERVLKTLQLEQPNMYRFILGYEAVAGGYQEFLPAKNMLNFKQIFTDEV